MAHYKGAGAATIDLLVDCPRLQRDDSGGGTALKTGRMRALGVGV